MAEDLSGAGRPQPSGAGLPAPVQGGGRRQVQDGRASLAGDVNGLVDGLDLMADQSRVREIADLPATRLDQRPARPLDYHGVFTVHERQ